MSWNPPERTYHQSKANQTQIHTHTCSLWTSKSVFAALQATLRRSTQALALATLWRICLMQQSALWRVTTIAATRKKGCTTRSCNLWNNKKSDLKMKGLIKNTAKSETSCHASRSACRTAYLAFFQKLYFNFPFFPLPSSLFLAPNKNAQIHFTPGAVKARGHLLWKILWLALTN